MATEKKKRDPVVVAALLTAAGALLGTLVTTGGGLLTGLLQYRGQEPAKTETVYVTVTPTSPAVTTRAQATTTVPSSALPKSVGTDALSLRELAPTGARAFQYADYRVAEQTEQVAAGVSLRRGVSAAERYTMPNDRRAFRATVGLEDSAPPDSTGTFEVLGESGKVLKTVTVLKGKTEVLEVPVGAGEKFQLKAYSVTAEVTLVWVRPVLLR
ncbi:hypothetical protein JOF53_004153 [Crossiella equi]|uniref:Uncharacterized protein n=1 Tax=Crossiella equi TaxID=130796 RepID=A0ABS5AG14_9PSEU|nr:hypothetical protein [Crossiella equi]MBP2475281.1 hypothetical protein [Crossiella equi]